MATDTEKMRIENRKKQLDQISIFNFIVEKYVAGRVDVEYFREKQKEKSIDNDRFQHSSSIEMIERVRWSSTVDRQRFI